jgi:hypothetical protein
MKSLRGMVAIVAAVSVSSCAHAEPAALSGQGKGSAFEDEKCLQQFRTARRTASRALPPRLAQLHKLKFDYADGNGIDFEPYPAFLSEEETQSWFRAWTGNPKADGRRLLVFGQDGTGGYAAFWVQPGCDDILGQPVVFLGSEGELGVVASDFDDYLWLLAGNHGPVEAVAYPATSGPTNRKFAKFALKHSAQPRMSATEVVSAASAAFPGFKEWVRQQCR